MEDKVYHYFYKITNKLNQHFYFGIHSTKNLNDGYMGSGTRLHCAYKKYGMEFFEKEIIAFFDSREDASRYESEIVNESLLEDSSCYNIRLGGDNATTIGTVTVKDNIGNIVQISQKEFNSNPDKYVGVTHGTLSAINIETGDTVRMTVDEYRKNKHKFKNKITDKICVVDIDSNKKIWITTNEYNDDKIGTNKYRHMFSNKVLVKDENDMCFIVDKSDDRIQSGELKLYWKGKHHSQETKDKLKDIYKKTKHQQGEKNSQYGTCWILKGDICKKIKKDELDIYLKDGWIRGRKIKNKI